MKYESHSKTVNIPQRIIKDDKMDEMLYGSGSEVNNNEENISKECSTEAFRKSNRNQALKQRVLKANKTNFDYKPNTNIFSTINTKNDKYLLSKIST